MTIDPPPDSDQPPETPDDAFFDPVRDLLAEGEPALPAPEPPPSLDGDFFAATPAFVPDRELPPAAPKLPAAAAAPAADDGFVPVATVAVSGEQLASRASRRSRRRQRTFLLSAVAVLAMLAIIAVLVVQGGNSNQAAPKLRTGSPTTIARPAPTTRPVTATTTVSADGSEKTGPAGTTVTVNADVLFDFGAADLTPAASSRLGRVLTLAQSDTSRHILVEGYTDSTGDAQGNQRLSEARAQSVAQWLTQQGIDSARITVVGHGADNPVAPNDTPDHQALNRRVVVTLQTASAR